MTEPVATPLACLCGLDTNPVASPRMDIHCPKHDAPGGEPKGKCPICGDPAEIAACCGGYACTKWEREQQVARGSGEPELLPEQVVAMIKESVDCEYSDLVGYKARLGAALVDLNLLLNTRVSRSTSEPGDEDEARGVIEWLCNEDSNLIDPTDAEEAITRITTALAEARRAGTPTTDARERARKIVDEWDGDILPVPTKDYDRSRYGLIDRIASALEEVRNRKSN